MSDRFGLFTGDAVEVTRPADTTAYAANDAIGSRTTGAANDFVFRLSLQPGGSGYIVKAKLHTNQSTCVARFRLHLYNGTPAPIADNTICTVLYTNAAKYLGYIDFPAAANPAGASDDLAQALVLPGSTGTNSQPCLPLAITTDGNGKVYGQLETLDAFTPASGQKIRIALEADCNQ